MRSEVNDQTQAHVRIDNRLLHGQVVQFWIPHLEVKTLIIADDAVACNEAMPAIYRMAVPQNVHLVVTSVHELGANLVKADPNSTMVLLSDVYDASRAITCGAALIHLTLGNVHASPDRKRVTDAVYLSDEEHDELVRLKKDGCFIEIQTFPGEVLELTLTPKGGGRWSRS